jgi:sugar lactone lactonase YvrE
MRISVLADVKPLLGEGPLWDAEGERLYFLDALGRRVFRCTAQGGEMRAWLLPSRVGSMALWTEDATVVALADGFYRLDLGTGEINLLARPEPDRPGNALNDGKVDPQGRFLCGSMDLGEEKPTGALWRLDLDMSVTRLEEGIICSNGPCWSPDGQTFYFADSFRGRIWAYDYDVGTGAVANQRDFAVIDPGRGGAPDGATVDAEGFLWSAAVFDGRIRRFSPDGEVERTIEMPVCKITSLCFGGPGLDRLCVTSMAEPPLPKYPGDGPLRGSLFVIDGLGVTGRSEFRFAG